MTFFEIYQIIPYLGLAKFTNFSSRLNPGKWLAFVNVGSEERVWPLLHLSISKSLLVDSRQLITYHTTFQVFYQQTSLPDPSGFLVRSTTRTYIESSIPLHSSLSLKSVFITSTTVPPTVLLHMVSQVSTPVSSFWHMVSRGLSRGLTIFSNHLHLYQLTSLQGPCYCCLLWIVKVRTKDKTYIWISVWWKTTN